MAETQELGFRPLVSENTKFQPVKQIYAGYEIEKRFILMTKEDDHTKAKNGLEVYNEVLEKGISIRQGYIQDIEVAKQVLEELGIELQFAPNTIRLRQYGSDYILTLKDRKETKKRECEWELERKQFNKYWKLTKGSRIEKKRLVKKVKGHDVEFDAFLDRFLLLAEVEVDNEAALAKVPKLGMDITGQKQWTNKTLSK